MDGRYVGMPVWTNAEILFYRTDLFEDRKKKADFKAQYGYALAPPTTWQQFDDMADVLHPGHRRRRERPIIYGTDVKGAVETEWLATVAAGR